MFSNKKDLRQKRGESVWGGKSGCEQTNSLVGLSNRMNLHSGSANASFAKWKKQKIPQLLVKNANASFAFKTEKKQKNRAFGEEKKPAARIDQPDLKYGLK